MKNDFSFCYNKKGINTLPKNLMYIKIDNLQILELNNNKFIEIPLYISKLVRSWVVAGAVYDG